MSATFHAKNGHNEGFKWLTFESFRGLRPLDPRQGFFPFTPPGALYGGALDPTHNKLRANAHTESGKINFLAHLPSPQ